MIYLVDDAADYRFLVQQVFTLFLTSYPIRFFEDGAALVQHIESSETAPEPKPHLIILDVDMPRLNGLDTLERLRQHPAWQHVPVVVMTNRDAGVFIQNSYQLGASSFLLKPLDLTELRTVMTLLCQYWVDLNQIPAPDQVIR